MKTYYKTEEGINTGDAFVPKNHPYYPALIEQIEKGEASLEENPADQVTQTWETIRKKRDTLLSQSDWAVLPDVPLSNKKEWLTYRALLRQLPQLYRDPSKVSWPALPKVL